MSTPMQGAEQLRSARMKLQRAEEHLGQLVSEHERFIGERNPYRMLPELDPDPEYDVLWRVKIVDNPPLERWSSLAGECVHGMRSALDYLALALVQIHDPAATYAEFPILKDKFVVDRKGTRHLRWSKEAPRKLCGVDRRPMAQARWLQPYRRRDEMDVIDKHRRPNIVGPFVRGLNYVPVDCEVVANERFAGPFEDGTPIARYLARATGPNMHVEARFSFDIRFGSGEPLDGEPVMQRLQGLLAYTGFVLSRFDRFFN